VAFDPCYSAIVTTSTPSSISVVVFAALAEYGGYSSFTYASSLGSIACGSFSYTALIVPVTSISPTTFAIDSETMMF
jgi:hypothetical protein